MLLNSGASSLIGVFLQLILIIVCIDCLENHKVTFVIKVIVEHILLFCQFQSASILLVVFISVVSYHSL
jgi:hypothetical protein